MDGQTEFQQQYRALHYMQSRGKNPKYAFCGDSNFENTYKFF